MSLEQVRALTFDVFGTVVDWRSSVIRQCTELGARLGIETDWDAFVDDWRYDGYIGGIGKVIRGDLPFMTTDQLHRRKLEEMFAQRGFTGLSEAQLTEFNTTWHRLDPWPDAVSGLARLRTRFIVSTLSNGNFSLLVDMAKYAGLPWDCVISADVTGAFKPAPECYLAAARFLDLAPAQVMMVAAHKNDLQAAQGAGLQAAFVPRIAEAGPNRKVDLTPDPAFQVIATDFEDLAHKLGCPPSS
ncbi:MAG: haloacid dehalogenase type II [Dehalococcoidia bacterium]